MTQKDKINLMSAQMEKLETVTLQNSELLRKLSIIIEGSDDLGVEGIREKQQKDELFKATVKQELVKLNAELDIRFDGIVTNIEAIKKDIKLLQDWRDTWEKILNLITNSKTWRFIFILLAALMALLMVTKYKMIELLRDIVIKM